MVLDTVVITEGEGVRRVDGGEEGGKRCLVVVKVLNT